MEARAEAQGRGGFSKALIQSSVPLWLRVKPFILMRHLPFLNPETEFRGHNKPICNLPFLRRGLGFRNWGVLIRC